VSGPITPATTAEALAQRFHETYERLAPRFGYETRRESAVPWAEVPEQNRKLMTAVCAELLAGGAMSSVTALLEQSELDPATRRLITGDGPFPSTARHGGNRS
jgi:hypothetical protein